MKKAVIIVAGGSGSRMKSDIPKQFILLNKLPILMHTIKQFYKYSPSIKIVLVLPKSQLTYWNKLCKHYDFSIEYTLAYGGKTRFESVKNGLSLIDEKCLIGVHDGVRPLVSIETLDRCYSLAEKSNCAIPVTNSIDSIRKVEEGKNRSVDRSLYKMVQTPQVFLSTVLKKSYALPYKTTFTDDASVVENAGFAIHLTQGNHENIKVTTPMDLVIGTALMNLKKPTE